MFFPGKKISWYNAGMPLSFRLKKYPARSAASQLEILLAACFLSVTLVPLLFIVRMASPLDHRSPTEFVATLLAHHVMERIIAEKADNPESLPAMTVSQPIVGSGVGFSDVSRYFRDFLGYRNSLEEQHQPDLYHCLRPYQCQVDVYYLEGNVYKVIACISYTEEDRQKRVFLERLFDHPPPRNIAEVTP